MLCKNLFFILILLFILFGDKIIKSQEKFISFSNSKIVKNNIQDDNQISFTFFDNIDQVIRFSNKYNIKLNQQTNLQMCKIINDVWITKNPGLYTAGNLKPLNNFELQNYRSIDGKIHYIITSIGKPFFFIGPNKWYKDNKVACYIMLSTHIKPFTPY